MRRTRRTRQFFAAAALALTALTTFSGAAVADDDDESAKKAPTEAGTSFRTATAVEQDQKAILKNPDFRREVVRLGFKIIEGRHPIVPVMLGEAAVAQDMSRELLDEGVYIKGLWYPVVPKGEARLRAQISAAHTRLDLDRALEAFNKVGKRQGVI